MWNVVSFLFTDLTAKIDEFSTFEGGHPYKFTIFEIATLFGNRVEFI